VRDLRSLYLALFQSIPCERLISDARVCANFAVLMGSYPLLQDKEKEIEALRLRAETVATEHASQLAEAQRYAETVTAEANAASKKVDTPA